MNAPHASDVHDGTPRALRPIAEAVIHLVARARTDRVFPLTDDDLRRIELCALVALDVSMFHDLYPVGGDPRAPAPQVQEQR